MYLFIGIFLVWGPKHWILSASDQEIKNLPVLQKQVRTGFSNGGWEADRYRNMETLDAHRSIVIADLEGPGVIRHIHTTRHYKRPISTRGVVLLIYFDGVKQPAVQCPLGDFFGDGCNGKSMNFSTPLIECAPGSYNTYIPMPFKTRARVVLRNDTDIDLDNYSYVEWEPLEAWDPRLGYFHATYQRRTFQLTDKTKETFLHLKGTGHLLGRQFSVVTDEPKFKNFHFVMEGNNEVDIDGEERRLDYLGSEDSFTFSWGFQNMFAGLHAGMPLVKTGELNLLSIYRFHDHMPIRFNRELVWSINWTHEFWKNPEWLEPIRMRSEEGGCWVDYATVFYWYQDSPSGFKHHPIEPLDRRIEDLTKSSMPTMARQEKMNLSDVRKEIVQHIESLQVSGKPYGCYRLKPGGEAELYATCDVAIMRTIMGEDLMKSLTRNQCKQWIDYINSFAQEDGVYRGGRHSKQHRNGMVIGALGVLGGQQKYPVKLYEEFNTIEKVAPWLEKIDWSRQWGASHLFWGGMHCYSMSRQCTDAWRKAVFDWLDAGLDPETGWWRKGVEHYDKNQPLGGGAHIWPMYQQHSRHFPYPEKVIDSILSMQNEDGSWIGFGNYLDLDALYGLAYMRTLAPDYRTKDILKAVWKHGNLALESYRNFMASEPDTHALLAMVGELGLLQQLDPPRFPDTVKWTDIFSDARLYDTKDVECTKPQCTGKQ